MLHLTPTNPRPEGCSKNHASKTLELRLLHHYTIFTAYQLPSGSLEQLHQVWAVDVPCFGFSSPLVLHALLAISAQHLWALDPSNRSLAHASRQYFHSAIKHHKKALQLAEQSCSSEEAESILAAAMLITHHTWTAAHAEPIRTDEPYKLPLQTYYLARGGQALFNETFPWLKDSALLWFCQQDSMNPTSFTTSNPFVASGKADLDRLLQAADELVGKDQQTYATVAQRLMSLYASIGARPTPSWVFTCVATLPIRAPRRFLELLEMHNPVALALLARNMALLKMIEHKWWLHGAGEHQVAERAINGIATLMPPEWAWTMEWPLSFLEIVTQAPIIHDCSKAW